MTDLFEAAIEAVGGPAVFDGDDPRREEPPEAQPDKETTPSSLPPSVPSLLQLSIEDGTPPVATSSSLGGEWGVIMPS